MLAWMLMTARHPFVPALHTEPRVVALLFATLLCPAFFAGCNYTAAVTRTNTGVNQPHKASVVEDLPLLQLLSDIEHKAADVRMRELLAFHSNTGNRESARKKAAYVLAKMFKKSAAEEDIKHALPLFKEAEGVQALSGRAAFFAAECTKFLGDEQDARRELENAIAGSVGEQDRRARAQYLLAQSYYKALEAENASKIFEQIIKESPNTQYAIGAKYYLGQLKVNAHQEAEAIALWRQYVKECPDGRYCPQVLPTLKALPNLTTEDHMMLAEAHFYHGEPERALLEWSKVRDTSQWFKQAQCLFRLGKPNLAKQGLINAIHLHPNDTDVVRAAQLLCRPLSKENAVQVWQSVLAHCPKYADVALANIANRSQDEQKTKYYTELLTRFPESEYAPEASWWVLWSKILKGQSAAALKNAQDFSVRYEKARSGPRFNYWTGKLHERLKQPDLAREAYARTVELYPRDYYAYRAAGRLAALSGGTDSAWSTDVVHSLKIYTAMEHKWNWPEPPHLVPYEQIESAYGPAASMLAQLRQWDECLELTPEKDSPCPQLRAISLAKLGRSLEAINTMSGDLKGKPGETPDWQIAYPLLYARIMGSEGAIKKVDPFLAQALTREESRYNVDAVSPVNARGLMQLMPPTAYGVAKRLKVPVSGMRDIHKPEVNLKLGVDYLAYTLSRFGGNAMLAVASYNAGPNGVAGFTKRFSLADPDVFVEQIPYSETRDYVRKVFSSYWNYKSIYGHYLGR